MNSNFKANVRIQNRAASMLRQQSAHEDAKIVFGLYLPSKEGKKEKQRKHWIHEVLTVTADGEFHTLHGRVVNDRFF
jgi:hypothetical protein